MPKDKSFILKPCLIKLIPIILISILGVIVYSNSFNCSFQFDDDVYIINNYVIRNIQNLLIIGNFILAGLSPFFPLPLTIILMGLMYLVTISLT